MCSADQQSRQGISDVWASSDAACCLPLNVRNRMPPELSLRTSSRAAAAVLRMSAVCERAALQSGRRIGLPLLQASKRARSWPAIQAQCKRQIRRRTVPHAVGARRTCLSGAKCPNLRGVSAAVPPLWRADAKHRSYHVQRRHPPNTGPQRGADRATAHHSCTRAAALGWCRCASRTDPVQSSKQTSVAVHFYKSHFL